MGLDHLLPTPVNKSGRWVDADLIMMGTKYFRQGVAVSGRNFASSSWGLSFYRMAGALPLGLNSRKVML
jgi:hypothetical protein